MAGPHWIKRPLKDPYRRQVMESDVVPTTGTERLFALKLDCGHTLYSSAWTERGAPKHARCRVCIAHSMNAAPRRPLSLAEAAIAGYVGGAGGGVMAAAQAAIALEVQS